MTAFPNICFFMLCHIECGICKQWSWHHDNPDDVNISTRKWGTKTTKNILETQSLWRDGKWKKYIFVCYYPAHLGPAREFGVDLVLWPLEIQWFCKIPLQDIVFRTPSCVFIQTIPRSTQTHIYWPDCLFSQQSPLCIPAGLARPPFQIVTSQGDGDVNWERSSSSR